MSKVLVTREKLDKLASIIGGKADVAVPLTIDGTIAAAETLGKGGANLQTKSVSITPSGSAQSQSVTPDTGYDGMDQVNVNVSAVPEGEIYVSPPFISFFTDSGVQKCRIGTSAGISVEDNCGTPGYIEDETWESKELIINAIPLNMRIIPTESVQTLGRVNTMMMGAVTIDAIPSNYVGSSITQRTSSDVTSSGDTVTIPGGFYGSSVTKIISAVTQDNDGYLVLDDEGSGGGGSSGLVYETGTFTPSENIVSPTISFANTHTDPPIIINMTDIGDGYIPSVGSNIVWQYFDPWLFTGYGFPWSNESINYAMIQYAYLNTTGSTSGGRMTCLYNSSQTGSTQYYPSYFANATRFVPFVTSSRYWISGRTYKWIAVWAPTT